MNVKEITEKTLRGDTIKVHVSNQSGVDPVELCVIKVVPSFMGPQVFVNLRGKEVRVCLGLDGVWMIAGRR